MNINYLINQLINYGKKNSLIYDGDEIYCANRLIDLFKVDCFSFEETTDAKISDLLHNMCDYAYEQKIILDNDVTTYDLFDTQIMDILTPRPSSVVKKFNHLSNINKQTATDYYYDFSIKTNYIRMDRIKRNVCYKYESKYGVLDITINLSKPEKDPKLIALSKMQKQTNYPKCLLCYENVGFAGNLNHPARYNHRIIPLKLNDEEYFMQYSPYVYYNEHTIVFNKNHQPMVINGETLLKILDFVNQFNHYFLGSNADLPIVGGSILSHDHFQGGRYTFPMFEAKKIKEYGINIYPNVFVSYLNWPLDTICLRGINYHELAQLGELILNKWKNYSVPSIKLIAHTNEISHNTITPIARKKNGYFELYLVLRNNRTDDAHQYGIFHPNEALHHIKKENIGLIEVMGLAVLPKRLNKEMELLKEALLHDNALLDSDDLRKHKEWAINKLSKYYLSEANFDDIVKMEIGRIFTEVLEDCSVFRFGNKIHEMDEFINYINKSEEN